MLPGSTDEVAVWFLRRVPVKEASERMMMGTWWWFWIAYMFLFLVPPIGYGWGYRGWGAPYPSYIQRRRGQAAVVDGSAQRDHYAWGWGGDFVWMILLIGMLWAFGGIWWR